MRFALILICVSTSMLWANNAYSQSIKLSIQLNDVSVREVLAEIERNSEFIFIFRDDIVNLDRKVSMKVKAKTIDYILDELFRNSNNRYEIIDRQVVILKKESTHNVFGNDLMAQPDKIQVTGVVTDEKGEPMPGVNVIIKGTSDGVVTDVNGKYIIAVPNSNAVLIFSFIGYAKSEMLVGAQKSINIALTEDAQVMDEVVVVGFGSQKRASVVGAVQTIKPQELVAPTANLSSNFAGRIAGVIAVQQSGEPGADAANFWIRGIATFGDSPKEPLVILDGVEVKISDINALSPEVIDGFSLLKDASATALYGAKGANGVLVVTTKSGKEGEKARVNVRIESSFSAPTQLPKLAKGVTYMEMYNEAGRTRAANPATFTPRYTQEKIDGTRNQLNPYVYPDVDWYSEVFKPVAWNQNANINISGGSKIVNYFINASVRHDQGLFTAYEGNSINTNQNNMRYAFQNNLSAKITPTTRVGLKVSAVLADYNRPRVSTSGLFSSTMSANPVEFPVMFPSEDASRTTDAVSYTMFGNRTGGPTANRYPNPFADLVTGQRSVFESTVLAILNVDQDLKFITEGLKIRGLISFRNWNMTRIDKYYTPYYYEIGKYTENNGIYDYTLNRVGTTGATLLSYSTALDTNQAGAEKMTNIQAILEYNREFGDHNVGASLVYLQTGTITNLQYLPTNNQGLAGRATYNYRNKYFAEFNFGYNGSENFAEGKRFGFFPSYAVGYLISSENFFEPLRNTISLLKVRASFGYVGNSYTNPRFPYLTEVTMNNKEYKFGNEWQNSKKGPTVTKYGNPNATWEVSEKTDIGLELGLFNHKVMLIADYFYESRTGIFMQRQTIPASLGIGSSKPWGNVGKVTNQGVDLTLDYRQSFGSDWDVSFKTTFTYAKNKLIEQDEPKNTPANKSKIGKPLNNLNVLIADKLLTEADLNDGIDRDGYAKVQAGDIKYVDMNGDDVISNSDITALNETTVPQIVYGFGPSVRYKRWDLSLFFQGSAKVSLLMSGIHPFGQMRKNVVQYIADSYWTEANPDINATYPRLSDGDFDNNTQTSSFWARKANFLRLKQMEIGYTYKNARVYASGINLLTFTSFKLWDPEMGGGNGLGYPPVRVINLGFQFNF